MVLYTTHMRLIFGDGLLKYYTGAYNDVYCMHKAKSSCILSDFYSLTRSIHEI
jgi:hypothetical protein